MAKSSYRAHPKCPCGVTASIAAFQAEEVSPPPASADGGTGSIPVTGFENKIIYTLIVQAHDRKNVTENNCNRKKRKRKMDTYYYYLTDNK